jgi:hypothetical protein
MEREGKDKSELIETIGAMLKECFSALASERFILYDTKVGDRFLIDRPLRSLPRLPYSAAKIARIPSHFCSGDTVADDETRKQLLQQGWLECEVLHMAREVVRKMEEGLKECDTVLQGKKWENAEEREQAKLLALGTFLTENPFLPFVKLLPDDTQNKRVEMTITGGKLYALAIELPPLGESVEVRAAYIEVCTMVLAEGLRVSSLSPVYFDYELHAISQTLVLFLSIRDQ